MNVLRRIRDALPPSWFDNVDYDTSENIDWNDDFDPNEPRVPKGQPGGGQWTVSGAGAGPAPALTKYAGPAGKAMKALVDQHIASGGDPMALGKQIVAQAAQFKSSNVAGYMNQLLHHLTKHYGVAPGTFGKAVKKIEGEASDPPDTPPTDVDTQKVAAAVQAQAIPPAPVIPVPDGSHPNASLIADIIDPIKTSKWSDKEKLDWANALEAEIPDGDPGKAFAQQQIAKFVSGGQAPANQQTTAAIAAAGGPAGIAASVIPPEPTPESQFLPEPTTVVQTSIHKIFNHPTMTAAEKMDAINAKLPNMAHPPNINYAEQAITALEDQAEIEETSGTSYPAKPAQGLPDADTSVQKDIMGIFTSTTLSNTEKIAQIEADAKVGYAFVPNAEYAAQAVALLKGEPYTKGATIGLKPTVGPAKEAEPTGPYPATEIQLAIVKAAKSQGNSSDKLALMQAEVDKAGLQPTDESFDFAKKWAASLYGGAGGTLYPAAVAMTPEPTEPTVAPGIEAKLPTPAMFQTNQSEMWGFAADPMLSHSGKVGQIQHTISQIFPPGDKDYGHKLLTVLSDEQHKLEEDLPQPPAGPGNAIKTMMYGIGYDPDIALNDKIDKLNNEIQMAGSDTDKAYAESLIAYLKNEPPPAPAADLSKPLTPEEQHALEQALPFPGGTQAEQDLWETAAMKGWSAAQKIKQLEADQGPNGIAELGTSALGKQINAYAKTLIEHLKKGTPKVVAKAPLPLPKIPYALAGGPFEQTITTVTGNDVLSPAEKIEALKDKMSVTGLPENSPGGKYIMSVIAALGGGATPAAPSIPKVTSPIVANHPFIKKFIPAVTSSANTAAQLQEYLNNSVTLGDVDEGTDPHDYAKQLIAWKHAQEGTAPATTSQVPKPPQNAGLYAQHIFALTSGSPPTLAVQSVATFLVSKMTAGEIREGSPAHEYAKQVITALGGTVPPSPPKAAKEVPTEPPAVPDPKTGSMTQNKMWVVAIKKPSDPTALTNTAKIAEITKMLAESSGGMGGAAETYANSLITALGGQPTTVNEAKAAQPGAQSLAAAGAVSTPQPYKAPKSYSSEVSAQKYTQYKKNAPKPNPEEKSAVYAYTDGDYNEINDNLRKGHGLTPHLIQKIKQAKSFLARAKFPEDAVLTRKISGEYAKELLSKLQKGSVFVDQGFGSTDHWSGDLTIKINIKKGQKAAAVGHMSAHPNEKEIIIQMGANYRVVDFDAVNKYVMVDLLDESDPDFVM